MTFPSILLYNISLLNSKLAIPCFVSSSLLNATLFTFAKTFSCGYANYCTVLYSLTVYLFRCLLIFLASECK